MIVPASSPAKRTSRRDAVTLEVIRHGLVAAAEQMATAIERSAHSQVIREMLDYSTAVFDRSGGIVAQSTRKSVSWISAWVVSARSRRRCSPGSVPTWSRSRRRTSSS